ncbi:hypothetical protein [Desulfolucanica intricata]|uniref:hypothetical protein n=1 Tax=Desulfolucanica intricata TaxID=1285191 RepID=UPI000835D7C2|nr:hypothetical protein [Desulfolucanica intricata]
MNRMYYLTNLKQLPVILKNGIQIDNKDILPRTYLTDDWQWVLKMSEILNNLTEVSDRKSIVVLELDLTGIHVFPDDMPSDILAEYWGSTKDEYSKHCFFTSEKIPVSSIKKIYDLDCNELTSKIMKI